MRQDYSKLQYKTFAQILFDNSEPPYYRQRIIHALVIERMGDDIEVFTTDGDFVIIDVHKIKAFDLIPLDQFTPKLAFESFAKQPS